jgi:hypothetical protein
MMQFPAVPPGDRIKISASNFAVFQQCPESAAARLQGRYGPDTLPAFSGGLAHRVFARHLSVGPIAPEDLPGVCRQEIGSSTLNLKLASVRLKPSSLAQVVEDVGALYERFRKMPTDGFEAAEVHLEAEPWPDVLLVGSVDAVFQNEGNGTRLVDWKTGDLGELVSAQLRFYALLWALERGEAPHAVEAVSVRTGERVADHPSADHLSETAQRVTEMVERLRRAWSGHESLERYGGPWCRYCPLLEECEEGRSTMRLMELS